MNVNEIFRVASIEMSSGSNSARAAIPKHAGEKGEAIQNVFCNFLKGYLPKAFGISSGFIYDIDGNISKQIDAVIYDAARTPIIYGREGSRGIPIES